jgi:hypothetical protein
MKEDRIDRLSQRFNTHAVGRKPVGNRSRAKHTFYVATELVNQLDELYQEINHELYPQQVNKSTFLENLIEYALAHRAELKDTLSQTSEPPEAPTPDAPTP